ncbi:hypothetical protein QE410_003224 [Microbacterium sp. SORGH_AS 1204]|nr:hypothetical protein [Microbacterium sp. SORGH_AS_1204]
MSPPSFAPASRIPQFVAAAGAALALVVGGLLAPPPR